MEFIWKVLLLLSCVIDKCSFSHYFRYLFAWFFLGFYMICYNICLIFIKFVFESKVLKMEKFCVKIGTNWPKWAMETMEWEEDALKMKKKRSGPKINRIFGPKRSLSKPDDGDCSPFQRSILRSIRTVVRGLTVRPGLPGRLNCSAIGTI